jgi:hypothetical protein
MMEAMWRCSFCTYRNYSNKENCYVCSRSKAKSLRKFSKVSPFFNLEVLSKSVVAKGESIVQLFEGADDLSCGRRGRNLNEYPIGGRTMEREKDETTSVVGISNPAATLRSSD